MKNNILLTLFLGCFMMIFESEAQTCQNFSVSISSTSHILDANNTVVVCLGDSITFQAQTDYLNNNQEYIQSDSTSQFIWLGINNGGNSLNSTTITTTYNQGGIYPVTCMPLDMNLCYADSAAVAYVIVSQPSDIGISISPSQIEYCEGDSVTISANPVYDDLLFVETDTIVFSYENDSLLFLPDGNGVSYEAAITVPSFIEDLNFPLQDIIVCMDIEHSFVGDLEISLICPTNNAIKILPYPYPNPNSPGNFFLGEPVESDEGGTLPLVGVPYQYCFESSDSSLPAFINTMGNVEGSIPMGTYAPYDSLQQLLACDITGDWKLRIIDNLFLDNGVLFSWSIGLVVDNNLIVQDIDYDSIMFANSLQDINIELPDGSLVNQNAVSVQLELEDEFTFVFIDENACEYEELIDLVIQDTTNQSNSCFSCQELPAQDTIYICPEETSVEYLDMTYEMEGSYLVNGILPFCNTEVDLTIIQLDSFDYDLEILPADSTDSNGQIVLSTPGYTFLNDSIGLDLAAGIYNIDIYYGSCMESTMVEVPVYQELMAEVTIAQNIVSNNTYTVTANITGGLAPYVIEWSTGDMGDLVLNDLVTGNYWVSVTDAYMSTVIVNFEVGDIVSINLPEAFKSIDVFPNPANENLNINIQLEQYSEIFISIFEASGKEVLNYSYSGVNVEESLAISHLNPGVYFIGIQSGRDRVVRKITIL